jgi:lipoyl synthase
LKDNNILVSLFAFKPLAGTVLEKWERVSYDDFHRIQMGSYLIQNGICRLDDFVFDQDGFVVEFGPDELSLKELIRSGIPFMNRGCPRCNRVFYETLPGERFYSYPRNPTPNEISYIERAFSISEDVCTDDLAVPLYANGNAK